MVATYDRPVVGAPTGLFTVDGPHAVEIEDLPEVLASAVLAPRFLVEISLPAAATEKDRSAAIRLARALAERFGGAVYDPQADALAWPKGRKRAYIASVAEERIRVVELSWYVADAASLATEL